MKNPTLTLFIPCYNRSHTICRALDSVLRQTLTDYEILVIDDGSTDSTRETVEHWASLNNVEVRYVYQSNGGKHTAHNHAVILAKGRLLMVLDSDDQLLPDCLENVLDAWTAIPVKDQAKFAGVEGLCVTGKGDLHGTPFPSDIFDSNYLEITGRYGVTGEKRNAIRLDVLRQFPYPVFPGEYHVRPSFIWKRISHAYKFRYINRHLQVVDFAPDGLTATSSKRRLLNIQGLLTYWRDDIHNHQQFLTPRQRRKHYAEYIRYSLHNCIGLHRQWQEVPDRALWLHSLPRALPNFLADLYKKR